MLNEISTKMFLYDSTKVATDTLTETGLTIGIRKGSFQTDRQNIAIVNGDLKTERFLKLTNAL